MLRLADVIEALGNQRPDNAEHEINQAVIDSRNAIPGCIFVALPGEQVNGHDYVGHAFEQGASFALVDQDLSANFNQLDLRTVPFSQSLEGLEEPVCLLVEDSLSALQQIARFWRAKLDIKVIGITGSVGKSTTKEMVAEVLSHRYSTLKNEGNYNNEIGLPMTILGMSEDHERAVLEMGFYVPGEIQFLCDIAKPEIGVVTNIGTVHAERAGSQEMIAEGWRTKPRPKCFSMGSALKQTFGQIRWKAWVWTEFDSGCITATKCCICGYRCWDVILFTRPSELLLLGWRMDWTGRPCCRARPFRCTLTG